MIKAIDVAWILHPTGVRVRDVHISLEGFMELQQRETGMRGKAIKISLNWITE